MVLIVDEYFKYSCSTPQGFRINIRVGIVSAVVFSTHTYNEPQSS